MWKQRHARESFSVDADIRFGQCFFIGYLSRVYHVCRWYFTLVEKRAATAPNFPICICTFGLPFNSLHRVHRRIFFRRSGLLSTAKFINERTRRRDDIFFSRPEVVDNNVDTSNSFNKFITNRKYISILWYIVQCFVIVLALLLHYFSHHIKKWSCIFWR